MSGSLRSYKLHFPVEAFPASAFLTKPAAIVHPAAVRFKRMPVEELGFARPASLTNSQGVASLAVKDDQPAGKACVIPVLSAVFLIASMC